MANNNIPPEQPFTDQVSELGYQYIDTYEQYRNKGFGTLDGWTNHRVEYLRQNEDGTTTKIEYFYNNSSKKFEGVRATTLSSNGRSMIDSKTFKDLGEFYDSSYAQKNISENTGESQSQTGNDAPTDPNEFEETNNSEEDIEGSINPTTTEDEQKQSTASDDNSGNLIETDPPDSTEFKEKKEEGTSSKFSFDIHDISTKVNSFTTSLVDTAKNNISNILSNQEESTFNADAYESFKNLNIKVDLTDVKELRDKVIDAADYFNENIVTGIDNIITSLEELNPKTKEKLQKTDSDLEYLKLSLSKTYRNNITEGFNDLIDKLTQNIKDNRAIDDEIRGSSASKTYESIQHITNTNTGSGGESTETTPIEDIVSEIPINQDTINKLTPAIAGMVTFTEIVSMYTTIGSENSVQSSLTGNYGLLGLVHQNDKYYYKIIDKSTGQVYFVEMNDKAKITWDDKGERQAIEVVGDNAFVMKLPQEGDVLVRTADVGDVYFLNGDKMTFDGIDYYNITDSITGETAYIPVSEAISGPTLVSNLGSTSLSDSLGEVIK